MHVWFKNVLTTLCVKIFQTKVTLSISKSTETEVQELTVLLKEVIICSNPSKNHLVDVCTFKEFSNVLCKQKETLTIDISIEFVPLK